MGGCPTGEARITPGYRLFAKWVIHTVGPVWWGGEDGKDEALANCYRNSFALVRQHNIRSVAFPAISTGAYGFPVDRAARIAVRESLAFLENDDTVRRSFWSALARKSTKLTLTLPRKPDERRDSFHPQERLAFEQNSAPRGYFIGPFSLYPGAPASLPATTGKSI